MMAPGKLDILTVIPTTEIISKGIPYVKSLVVSTNKTAWAAFWSYFLRTWMNTYGMTHNTQQNNSQRRGGSVKQACFFFFCANIQGFEVWNVNSMSDEQVLLRNRTNNPLERHNRELNKIFPASHPNLLTFIETVKKNAIGYLKIMDDIRRSIRKAPGHGGVVVVKIPIGYYNFKAS